MLNYKPISVLSSFSKLIEKLVHVRLMSYLTTNNILDPSQHGFRPKQNVTTVIIDMLNYATNTKADRLIILLLFIDISKAFDSLEKLQHCRILGIVHQ